MQFVAYSLQFGDINDCNAETLRRAGKVRQSFLMQRINLCEHHVLWIMTSQDGSCQKIPITCFIEPAKEGTQRVRQAINLPISRTKQGLVPKHRRECLD